MAEPTPSAGAPAPEKTLRLAGFDRDGIADGPGLRCVVFVQGCPHHCPGCQNPQTWPFEGGQEATPSEIRDRIEATVLDTGVTFSGGEPFAQADALAEGILDQAELSAEAHLRRLLSAMGYREVIITFSKEYPLRPQAGN